VTSSQAIVVGDGADQLQHPLALRFVSAQRTAFSPDGRNASLNLLGGSTAQRRLVSTGCGVGKDQRHTQQRHQWKHLPSHPFGAQQDHGANDHVPDPPDDRVQPNSLRRKVAGHQPRRQE